MEKKKLENLKKLLINVDMVNGFVRKGAMADPKIGEIIPAQIKLIEQILKDEEGLAFIKDTHEKDCREFDRYPVHCLKNTFEACLVDELKPYEKDALIYEKNSTSTIYAPGFISDLNKMKQLREVIITGCCTDICILNLAIPLQNYFDEMDKRVNIVIPKNAVETYDNPNLNHNRDEYNEMAYKFLNQAGIQLVKKYNGGNNYEK